MSTLTHTSTLVTTECWCGLGYAVPETLLNFHRRQRDNNQDHFMWCPIGHQWQFSGKSKLDRMRERAEAAEAQAVAARDQLNAEKRAHKATKAAATRAANRATKGVCPHPDCHRSFVDVARHVRTKHPELVT